MEVNEFIRMGLALLFITAGGLKLSSLASMRQTLGGLGFPAYLRSFGAVSVTVLELLAGILLLFTYTATVGECLVLALIVMFAAAIAKSLQGPVKVTCSCFGSSSSAVLGKGSIPRLAAMLIADAVLLFTTHASGELWEVPYDQLILAALSWLIVACIYMISTRIYSLLRA